MFPPPLLVLVHALICVQIAPQITNPQTISDAGGEVEEEGALDNGEWLVEVEGVADGTELLGLEAYRGWLGEAACCDSHTG